MISDGEFFGGYRNILFKVSHSRTGCFPVLLQESFTRGIGIVYYIQYYSLILIEAGSVFF